MYKTLIEQQGFKLLEQIDNTLHTEIWKANQRELDRVVCLQILKPEAAQNALELEHFLVIARTFAKVKNETITAVFDIVSTSDIHYVVMEYVEGPTVGSLVVDGNKLSEAQILQIASSLAVCFEQLWQKDRIIHRNLKGQTVQIDPRGVAKLTDFSLAVTASQDLALLDSGHIVGTPSFIAPEYAQGSKNLNTQADMYSFGALLYQLSTGHAPFSSLSPVEALGAQIRSQIPPPNYVNSEISIEFSWFIHRLMMKNPNNRYPNWHDVISDIHLLMRGKAPAGIQTEERFLSTIDSRPLLDAMNDVDDEEDENDGAGDGGDAPQAKPYVRLRPRQQQASHFELDHKGDIKSNNSRSFAWLMTVLMLAWFGGVFWYRGIWVPEMQRISDGASKEALDVVAPPPTVVATSKNTETEPVVESKKDNGANMNHDASNDSEDVRKRERRHDKPPMRPFLPPALRPVQPMAVETNAVQQPVAPRPMPDNLKKALESAAKAGDLEAMREALSGEEAPFMDKGKLKSIMEKASTANKLLERGMETKKDQPISFTWRGKSRIVVPREVTENSVTLEANGRRQEIMFSDLTPDEMASLINKPQSEAETLSYCLLLMRTTHKSEIPLYASKCLPFQDILLEAIKE
ncbi:MAG: serine/threonine-protein kinase [bacterium]